MHCVGSFQGSFCQASLLHAHIAGVENELWHLEALVVQLQGWYLYTSVSLNISIHGAGNDALTFVSYPLVLRSNSLQMSSSTHRLYLLWSLSGQAEMQKISSP